ncbi:hypothetical protein Salat_0477000 [Sesamum alatum]|uniref:Uncharacterized protein n=1 Tax=Sesamum alatum TaxID=300844 RepID=A0AAE1Z4K8_9LAMI|nr:hypothetical protein Salat_0477000 [Sesamum alatum]
MDRLLDTRNPSRPLEESLNFPTVTKARGKSRNSVKGIFVNPVGRGRFKHPIHRGTGYAPTTVKPAAGKIGFKKRYRLAGFSEPKFGSGLKPLICAQTQSGVEDSKIDESKVSIGFILPLLSFDDVQKRKEKTF